MSVNWSFIRIFIRDVGWLPFLWRFAWRQLNKRLLRRGINIELPTGLVMHAPPWSNSAGEVVYTNANVDWGSERLLMDNLDHEGTFIDVGAHVGYYSLLAAPCVNKVYAFEPDVRSVAELARNLSKCPHAEAINKAVFSTNGEMYVHGHRGAVGFVHLVNDANPSIENGRLVDVVSIDGWMSERPSEQVTGIKIDIDGLDFEVLKGALEVLRRDHPLVLMEFLPTKTNDFEALFRFLDELGYAAFAFQRSRNNGFALHRLSFDFADHSSVKMIFLTPRRLIESFAGRCH